MPLQVIEKKIERNGVVYQAALIVVHKGLIVLVSDDQFAFGSIAIASPTMDQYISRGSVLPVVGVKNEHSARIISETIARKTNRLVLGIVRLKNEKYDVLQAVIKLIEEVLKDVPRE